MAKCWAKSTLPVLEWLPQYKRSHLGQDVVAGLTVGLMVVPQGIAYGFLAGLPPQHGLYSALLPGFVYAIFGTSPKLTIGPVALLAVMIAPLVALDEAFASLAAFTTGIVVMLASILKLGFVVNFFSAPVTSGFVSAASLLIAANQVKSLLGITGTNSSSLPGLAGICHETYLNIHTFRWQDATLSASCVTLLLTLKAAKDLSCVRRHRQLGYFSQFAFITRNALVVVSSALLAYLLNDVDTFALTGSAPSGPPPLRLPWTSDRQDLWPMLLGLGRLSLMLPLVATMQHVAIAKSFQDGRVDADRELLALGVVNLLGSFVCAMPVTASFGRTAVNASSGVRTPLGGVVTGLVVLSTLLFLMPCCAFIPKATLASVIVCAVLFSIDVGIARDIFHNARLELLPLIVTFTCCLFWALDYGIMVGIAVSLALPLSESAKPKVALLHKQWQSAATPGRRLDLTWASPDRGLFFPGADAFGRAIGEMAAGDAKLSGNCASSVLVLDLTSAHHLDYTAVKVLKRIFHESTSPTVVFNPNPSLVELLQEFSDNKTLDKIVDFASGSHQLEERLERISSLQQNGTNCSVV